MIRKCTIKDKEVLLEYLNRDTVGNTFILADINDFGFDRDFQTVYADMEEGVCSAVYLIFYENLLLSCAEDKPDMVFLRKLFERKIPDVVMGKEPCVRMVHELLGGYTMKSRQIYVLDYNDFSAVEPDLAGLHIVEAGLEDVDSVFDFLSGIEELKNLYTSKDMIRDRIRENSGKHYLIRKGDRIIAHANSAAGSRNHVMIGGVGVDPSCRGKKLAGYVVSRLCSEILDQGRSPCLFSSRGEKHNLYVRLGFKPAGGWATLERESTEDYEKKSRFPSYIPIYNTLYTDITSGMYEKGSLLPSETVLSSKYHVSRNTLRQALTILARDGYIYKIQGKGTFVTYEPERTAERRIYNFLREDCKEEIVNITADYNFGLPTNIAKAKLGLKDGEEVFASNNVYYCAEGAAGQSFLQIPVKILDKYGVNRESEEELIRMIDRGIYAGAAEADLIPMVYEADEQVMPYLDVQEGMPLLHIEELLYSRNGEPMARIKYYFLPGKYKIRFRM